MSEARLRAQVFVFEPLLTHSIWIDYGGVIDEDTGEEVIRSIDEMIDDLKECVREGRYLGWRLVRIEKEVMGNVD